MQLPLVQLNDTCYTYSVNTSRTPDWSAVAALFNVPIAQLLLNNADAVLWQAHNYTALLSGCEVAPDCPLAGSAMHRIECVETVFPDPANASRCVMAWRQPDLSARPLTDGQALMLCDVPDATFDGAPARGILGRAFRVPAGETGTPHVRHSCLLRQLCPCCQSTVADCWLTTPCAAHTYRLPCREAADWRGTAHYMRVVPSRLVQAGVSKPHCQLCAVPAGPWHAAGWRP